MKKKIILVFFLLLFTNTGFAFSINNMSTSSSDSVLSQVEYELPYPGILPDNPLYFIKATRDKVVAFLINDPYKKVEFDLLTSDKRLNSGVYLVKRKKYDLAISTISKSNNYFEEAIFELIKVKRMGKDAKPILEKLKTSLKKHQEILESLLKEDKLQNNGQLLKEEERLKDFEKLIKDSFN